jgi:hypothetical protein
MWISDPSTSNMMAEGGRTMARTSEEVHGRTNQPTPMSQFAAPEATSQEKKSRCFEPLPGTCTSESASAFRSRRCRARSAGGRYGGIGVFSRKPAEMVEK